MEASDVKRLRELEEETRRLKQMYADLSPKAKMQEEIIRKAIADVPESKVWAQKLQVQYDVSIAVSCQVVSITPTAYYYKPKLSNDSDITYVLSKLTDNHNY